MSNFFIPKRVNVGFQERQGTYTGKLAYIIYFDAKNKLRKETSWNSWRKQELGNEIYDNEPTSGFVLNRKVGDYVSDWNHRQAYVRVYDPRNFEFEITVENLLYILENATSTKGKGLEGDFVYGWDGKNLVLIPCEAPDYQDLVKLNELRHSEKKITARQLKIGATYLTRENQELVYMGKHDEYTWRREKKAKPQFWFYKRKQGDGYGGYFTQMGTVSNKIIDVISEEVVEDYADIFHQMEGNSDYSPVDDSKDEFVPYTAEEINEACKKSSHGYWYSGQDVYVHTGNKIRLQRNDEGFFYEIKNPNYESLPYWNRNYDKRTPEQKETHLKYKFTDAQDVVDRLKPLRKRKYLENGRLYSEGY